MPPQIVVSHALVMVEELEALRDAVAAAARVEKENISYRAYILQAQSIRSIRSQVTSLWADALAKTPPDNRSDTELVEAKYVGMLSSWLKLHVATAEKSLVGGEFDEVSAADKGTPVLEATRLWATRHLSLVTDFVQRHAAILDARQQELTAPTRAP